MDINKRHFIFKNINKISNHNKIIDFLKNADTKYTENKNGIFLNLNTIDDNKIDHIYLIINEAIINVFQENIETIDEIEINQELIQDKKINYDQINHNDIFLSLFTSDEQEVIKYSKLYL